MINNKSFEEIRKENFISRIKVNQNIEKLILLKLQKEYEENRISEKDMTKEQISKLKMLYQEQILKLRKEYMINKEKVCLLKIKNIKI